MIDLHCHILPGVDDGAKTIEDSLAMARMAVSEGITHILATPHHKNKVWNNEKKLVQQLVNELQSELNKESIPLTVFPGQEIRINGEIIEDISQGTIQFIDEQEQYLLIEFPTNSIPHYTDQLFFDLQTNGITPIIVHPERNRAIYKEPELLKSLVEKGALAQLTAVSYTGGFGKDIQKFSEQLIESNLVHFIASDAHNVTNRPFLMKDAIEKLRKEFGQEKVEQFHQVTKDLVNGEVVIPPQPQSIKKKKMFFF